MPLRRELDIPVNPACQSPNRSDLWPCQQRQRLGGGGAARARSGGATRTPSRALVRLAMEPGAAGTCISIGLLTCCSLSTHVCTYLHALVSPVCAARGTHVSYPAPVRREPPFSLCFPRGRAHTVPRPAATSHTLRCSHTLHGLPYVHTFARPCCCAPVGLPALCALPSMLPQASPVA